MNLDNTRLKSAHERASDFLNARASLFSMVIALSVGWQSIPAIAQEISITVQVQEQVMELSGNYELLVNQLGGEGVFIPQVRDKTFLRETYPMDPISAWPKEEPTQDMITCSNAVREFNKRHNNGWPINEAGSTTTEQYLQWDSGTIIEWRKSCLQSDEVVHQDTFVDRRMSIEPIKNNLGYFYLDAVPFCSGILISDTVVLTARHCFSPEEPSTPMFNALTECEFSPESCLLEFATYAEPDHIVRISGTTQPKLQQTTRVHDHQDYLYLTLSAARPSINVVITTPEVGDKLFVGGFLPIFELEDFGKSFTKNGVVYFSPRLHWSADLAGVEECQVKVVANECVYHTCQTLNGFSGTPLIRAANENEITVVGLHIGGADRHALCGASSAASFNRGITPPAPNFSLKAESSS